MTGCFSGRDPLQRLLVILPKERVEINFTLKLVLYILDEGRQLQLIKLIHEFLH